MSSDAVGPARPDAARSDSSGSGRSRFAEAQQALARTGYTPRRDAKQFVLGAILLALLAAVLISLGRNPALQWDVVGDYLFDGRILAGLQLTLWLTLSTIVLAFLLGALLAAMQLSDVRVLAWVAHGFVWFFRSVPLLVQLIFWYNIGYLYPRIAMGVPFGPELFSIRTQDLISSGAVAVIALTLHEAAFAAEIIRGGILSVPEGYLDAARALGFSRGHAFRRVQLPEALRAIIPPAGNLLVSTLKSTSMVSVIAVTDLLYAAQLIYNQNFLVIPLLVVVTVWYLVITVLISTAQTLIERRVSRSSRRSGGRTPTIPDAAMEA